MIITPFGHMDPAAKVPLPQTGDGFLLSHAPEGRTCIRRKEEKRPGRERFPSRGRESGPGPSAPPAHEEARKGGETPPAAKGSAREAGEEERTPGDLSSTAKVPWKEEGDGARRIPAAGDKEAPSPSSDLFGPPAPEEGGSQGPRERAGSPGNPPAGAALLAQPGASLEIGGERSASSFPQVTLQKAAEGSRDQETPFARTPLKGYRSRVHPTPEISPRKGESILKRIALFLDKDGGEAVLDLDPPSLGRLAVRMVMEGKKLELRLHAATEAVARFLEKNLAPLHQVLAEQGLTVTAFNVTSGGPDQDPGQFARDAESRALALRRGPAAPGGDPGGEIEPALPPPIRSWGNGSALDLFA